MENREKKKSYGIEKAVGFKTGVGWLGLGVGIGGV